MKASADLTLDDNAPARLGRYQLLERLGGGATSRVYAARQDVTGLPVAIKIIAADLQDEPETRERFFREAEVTAALHHPNIVRVIEADTEQGRPFIVMERLDGLSLPAYLRSDEVISLEDKLELMRQLCDGLQAAHDRGIVHRDIKPSNLFVDRSGHLKILDFGLARLNASTLTAMGQIVGTPDFMSPEQAEGHQVDHRSDIFSAAAVCYLIFTGRPPFAAADLRKTLHALLTENPLPMNDAEAPAALSRVLDKALAKNPAHRYQSCAALRGDLQNVHDVPGGSAVWKRIAAYVGMVRL
jgi:serine/threonine-protein kinase